MFRYAALLALTATLCTAAPTAAPAPVQMPTSHQQFIPALLELLEQTEQCLAGCTDAASVEAALPRLRELAEQARKLSAHQQTLPEPTVQDYMAAHPHVAEFNKLWEGVCGHLARLEQAGLITADLRDVLQLAPAER